MIRRESGAPKGGAIAAYAFGLATLAGLLIWQAGDVRLGGYVVGGVLAPGGGFAIGAWVGVRMGARLAPPAPLRARLRHVNR